MRHETPQRGFLDRIDKMTGFECLSCECLNRLRQGYGASRGLSLAAKIAKSVWVGGGGFATERFFRQDLQD